MVQLPTVIYMISHFENSVRIIYLDGRQHTDPDIVVRTFNGESIGRWEGETLVVDTKYFPGHHHWMDQGGARCRSARTCTSPNGSRCGLTDGWTSSTR
jgi:hypothetical protein